MGLGISMGVKCSKAPPIITFLGLNPSGVSIGPARPDRMIVTLGYNENDAGIAYGGGVTYNGVAATVLHNPTMSDWLGMNYLNVTTGTTLTTSGANLLTWMITGLTNNAVYSSSQGGTGGSSYSVNDTTPAMVAAVIAGGRSRGSASSGGATNTSGLFSLGMDYFANTGGGGNPSHVGVSGLTLGAGANAVYSADINSYSSGYGMSAVFY